MADFDKRLCVLENKLKQITIHLIDQKHDQDKFYLTKLFKLVTTEELETVLRITNEEKLHVVMNRLIDKYGAKINDVSLTAEEKEKSKEVNSRIKELEIHRPELIEKIEKKSYMDIDKEEKEIWDYILDGKPLPITI